MTEPAQTDTIVTLQKAWAHLMRTMGGTNLQRVRDARKAANHLQAMRRRR